MDKEYDPLETKLTRQMIAAGVNELASYDPRFEAPESVVEDIYRAMVRTRAKKSKNKRI